MISLAFDVFPFAVVDSAVVVPVFAVPARSRQLVDAIPDTSNNANANFDPDTLAPDNVTVIVVDDVICPANTQEQTDTVFDRLLTAVASTCHEFPPPELSDSDDATGLFDPGV